MSPAIRTSIEVTGRRLHRATIRFRRGLIGTIAVLALACAALGVASALQGPRIQGGQLNLSAAVAGPAVLRIIVDEAIAFDPKRVSVTPKVPISVQSDGDVVLIAFDRALDYQTKYRVALRGVTAVAGGAAADLTYDLTTPAFQTTWLVRASSGDRILTGRPGEDPVTLYIGARIQDFVDLGGAMLVFRIDDTGTSFADIVATDGSSNVEELSPPSDVPGRMELLTPVGTHVLYTFTTFDPEAAVTIGRTAFDESLMRLDLEGSHLSEPVLGVDGKPLSVDTLVPIPGTARVLIHTRAGNLYSYDVDVGTPPTLLASYSELIGLSADGHSVSVKDAFGPLLYDLDDGSETRIDPSAIVDTSVVPFVADVLPLTGGRWVERAVLPNADFTAFDSFVALDDGTSASVLFRTADTSGSIHNYRITANERYLIAELSPGGDSIENSDGYEVGARPRDVTTVLVDLTTGEIVGEWAGSHARW